jgi:hypothetical protein
VSLFRDASPDVDGLMFDCVAVFFVASPDVDLVIGCVWLSRLAAWRGCAVMVSYAAGRKCIT